MTSRRPALKWVSPQTTQNATNPGLWLDKFLDSSGADDSQAKIELIKEVTSIAVSDVYKGFYLRWRRALEKQGIEPREAIVAGRMVVGLGDESVLETSVTLHHTYGVPYIPGSALKGLAAAYARQRLEGDEWREENGDYYVTVFGDTEDTGFVTFYDALYIPPELRNPKQSNAELPLVMDVLTVHHQQYYQQGNVPPADWDDPVPVPFMSARGDYLLALGGPQDWVELTFAILKLALREVGIGAKTSSGYGRIEVHKPPRIQKAPVKPPEETKEESDVILESNVNNKRNAQVRVKGTDEILYCSDFPSSAWSQPKKGDTCRAVVVRLNGEAVKAVFKP